MIRRRNGITRAGSTPRRTWSGIAGGVLLAIGILWVGWLLLTPHTDISSVSLWPGALNAPTPVNVQATPLLAEGISLSTTSQTPPMSQQQAMLLANQLEPVAASQAKNVNARFVLLNYSATSGSATHTTFTNTPVWLVWYQHIPLTPGETVSSTHSSHDLYVFLDANGKEVLKVWV